MKKQGFSLLELLVVVGVIAILLAVGVSSYSTLQKKSRDAKRKGDLKALQQAAEQYYSICGYQYPTDFPSNGIVCLSPFQAIMPVSELPTDPKTGDHYTCEDVATCDADGFTICATPALEDRICVTNQQ